MQALTFTLPAGEVLAAGQFEHAAEPVVSLYVPTAHAWQLVRQTFTLDRESVVPGIMKYTYLPTRGVEQVICCALPIGSCG